MVLVEPVASQDEGRRTDNRTADVDPGHWPEGLFCIQRAEAVAAKSGGLALRAGSACAYNA